MSTTPTGIAEMEFIQLLCTVLGTAEMPDGPGSTDKRSNTDVVRGVIRSPIARRLLTAKCALIDHRTKLEKEHQHIHDGTDKPTEHDCELFEKLATCVHYRSILLHDLLWVAISEEHPQVAANDNMRIRDGWDLVSTGNEWSDIMCLTDKSSIANNFISHIRAIVSGKRISVREEHFEHVGKNEKVIGSVTDERIQTFLSLTTDIRNEVLKQVPEAVLKGVRDNDHTFIGNMTLNEVTRLNVFAKHYAMLTHVTQSLFWCGVRETVPAAAMEPIINIRRGWEVVKSDTGLELGEEAKIVITPFGPMLAVKIPKGTNPPESFFGRGR